jgi:hypothetical protein
MAFSELETFAISNKKLIPKLKVKHWIYYQDAHCNLCNEHINLYGLGILVMSTLVPDCIEHLEK